MRTRRVRRLEAGIFGELERAVFLDRPNRFTLECELRGRPVRAFLPNPGRMAELLLPGTAVLLEKSESPGRKMARTVVAVEREGRPVVVDTHRTNAVALRLLEGGRVPGLEDATVVRREVTEGGSRFDFLLERGNRRVLLEVKSCTLFGGKVAMFPDAVTVRGRRHVEELSALAGGNTECAVLFVVHWPDAEYFLPEYHTDPGFAAALRTARDRIRVLPLAVNWRADLTLSRVTRPLKVPWEIVEREAADRGCYLLILEVERRTEAEIGGLGTVWFPRGFYVYAGSARGGLSRRVARHLRSGKRLYWHVDRLRAVARVHAALPIRTADDLECDLARALGEIGGRGTAGFGASDCSCPSHLFGFGDDPLRSPRFHALVQHFRMGRLPSLLG